MKSFIKMPPSEDTSKAFESVIARSNNLFNGSLKENIFFLHIHKCGGSSINQAIKSCYLTWDITKDRRLVHLDSHAAFNAAQKCIDQTNFPSEQTDTYHLLRFRENLLLYYMDQKDINYIAGHFSFSATAYEYFFKKYAFITVLRDPVARWISFYFYNRNKQRGPFKIDTELEAFIESERGQRQGYEYVKFLGGADQAGDYTSAQAINRAKENLHKFSIVGCLEYQGDFVKQFEERFGRKFKIGVSNQSPKSEPERKSIISEGIKEKVREVCKPDIEIYQYAINNFVKMKN